MQALSTTDLPHFKAVASDMHHRFDLLRPERLAQNSKSTAG